MCHSYDIIELTEAVILIDRVLGFYWFLEHFKERKHVRKKLLVDCYTANLYTINGELKGEHILGDL